MTIITHELDKINNSFNKRLKYQKLIPCNCNSCQPSQAPYMYEFNNLLERVANNKLTIECNKPPYHEVKVLGLIDNAIDIKQLVPQQNPERDQSFNFRGDIKQIIFQLLEQGNILGDLTMGDHIKGNYTDKSRNLNNSGTINNSGAGAFSSGNINGQVANTINQLPNFNTEPDKKELKALLNKLQTAIIESELNQEDQEDTLQQIQAIAQALQNSQNGTMKKTAKSAMKMLRGTAAALPPSAAMVTICNQLPDLISKIF